MAFLATHSLDDGGDSSIGMDKTALDTQSATTTSSSAAASSGRQPQYEARETRTMTDMLLGFVMEGEAPDTSFKQKHFQAVAEAINEAIPGRQRDWKSVKNHHQYVSTSKRWLIPEK